MKSNSYRLLLFTPLVGSGIVTYVLKNGPRSLSQVARLIFVAKAKASLKGRFSHMEENPNPDDLIMNRMKFFERRMEVRTSVVYMHLDDL